MDRRIAEMRGIDPVDAVFPKDRSQRPAEQRLRIRCQLGPVTVPTGKRGIAMEAGGSPALAPRSDPAEPDGTR